MTVSLKKNLKPPQILWLQSLKKNIQLKKKNLFARTYKESKKQKELEYKPLLDELSHVYSRAYNYKIDTIIDCAQRLTKEYLEKEPKAIIAITEKALKNIAEHTDVEITVHPSDARQLNLNLAELKMANAARQNFLIVPDNSIKQGSLIVKANKSIIDAHISTKFQRALTLLNS